MKTDKEFFEALEAVNIYKEVLSHLSKSPIEFLGFECQIDMSTELKESFGLNDSIKFSLKANPYVQKVKYYYNDIEIKPDCYYLRPKDYHPVSTLRALQECIAQDKYNPDIKYLEDGKEIRETNN
jgi:hypothetical protein